MAHNALVSFKLLLQKMEKDVGLSDFSSVEVQVYLAICDLCNHASDSNARTKDLLGHDLVSQCGRATIFRAITRLEQENKIRKSDKLHGHYELTI